jgi:hypothetical protein
VNENKIVSTKKSTSQSTTNNNSEKLIFKANASEVIEENENDKSEYKRRVQNSS